MERRHADVVDTNTVERRKHWTNWCQYADYYRTNQYLDRKEGDHIIVSIWFATKVRSGQGCGQEKRVGVQKISDALGAISKTIKMGGRSSSINREEGNYLLPLEQMIEGYRQKHSPPKPLLAVPVLVVEEIFQKGKQHNESPVLKATGGLGVVVFYVLLRVGEYTITTQNKSTTRKKGSNLR